MLCFELDREIGPQVYFIYDFPSKLKPTKSPIGFDTVYLLRLPEMYHYAGLQTQNIVESGPG